MGWVRARRLQAAVLVGTVVVVKAVSAVAVLLNLSQEDTPPYGMYASGGDEKHVARLGMLHVEDTLQVSSIEKTAVLL